jgi:hypothetical protein
MAGVTKGNSLDVLKRLGRVSASGLAMLLAGLLVLAPRQVDAGPADTAAAAVTAAAAAADPPQTPVVTVLMHGYQPVGADDITWLNLMANAIRVRQGSGVPIYNLLINNSGLPPFYSLQITADQWPPTTSSKGAILVVNWSDAAFCLPGAVPPCHVPTDAIAREIAGVLLADSRLMSLPIHLIGHSRGGSVVSQTARYLGGRGAWVEHQTTLDPHPVSGSDVAVNDVSQNVIFADNYFRDGIYPAGDPILGAFNVDLSRVLTGFAAHSKVHSYYHFTIDANATSVDGEAFSSIWYPPGYDRTEIGYFFSRTGGGRSIAEANRDGYHDDLWCTSTPLICGTKGARSPVTLDGSGVTWPNVALRPLPLNQYDYQIGDPITVPFFYQDRGGPATLLLTLDDDTDPYDTTSPACASVNFGRAWTQPVLSPPVATFGQKSVTAPTDALTICRGRSH